MDAKALALLALTIASIATPLLVATPSYLGPSYAKEVARLATEWLKPFAPSNAEALKLLGKAVSNPSLDLLYRALTIDSDGDGVPDAFEYLDGLSPYLPKSFGYNDLAYFAGRIVVDGWVGDWVLNSRCVEELEFVVKGSRVAPVSKVMAATFGRLLVVAVSFARGFVYGNTSIARFSISIVVGKSRVVPLEVNQWGLALEAAFSYWKVFRELTSPRAELVMEVRVGGKLVEKVVASFNPLELPSLGPRCWKGFVEPLWTRLRSVEQGLPVYFVAVYGDNREARWWNQVEFSSATYTLFEDLRALDPVAIVGTGDHVGAGLRSQIEEFLRATAFLPNHWIVAGNHDWSYTKYADRPFWYNYTVPDLYYRDVGRWRFILFNAYALDEGMLKELHDLLSASCSESKFVVLVWHVPITYSHYNYPTDLSYWQAENLRNLVKEFRSCIKLMLFGHLHVFRVGSYLGIPYIVTGGGGAPLSSAKYGLPIYHFVALELFPNGTFKYVPIAIEGSEISVERLIEKPGIVTYLIRNRARSVRGETVSVPMRVETFVKGIHLEVFLVAKPGVTVVNISCSSKHVDIESNASYWFAYVWGLGVVEPSKGIAKISLPMGSAKNASIEASSGKVVVKGCSKCTVSTILRFEMGRRAYEVCLHPVEVEGLWVVDPRFVINASGAKISVLSEVTVVVSDGEETVVKSVSLPITPPKLEVKYFSRYVGKELRFEVCAPGASSVKVLIDGKEVLKVAKPARCFNVSIDVSRFGEGTHALQIVAISSSGSKIVESLTFVACWTPPEIVSPSVVKAPSIGSKFRIGAKSVAPLTLIIKCLNTSVSKVVSSSGGYVEVSIKPIDLGIVGNGTYVLKIVAYDEVGHESKKIVELVVGTPTTFRTATPTHVATSTATPTTTASTYLATTSSSTSATSILSTSSMTKTVATKRSTATTISTTTSTRITSSTSTPFAPLYARFVAIAIAFAISLAVIWVLIRRRKGRTLGA